ncbi:MAG: DUF2284 domain-containing protein [Firmicutes bacterium]|nr:DUF2284 domain-containing protein [Bacillota bacterium]
MTDIQAIVKKHFPLGKEIPFTSVEFKEEVRKLCEQNTCGKYDKCWTCPPAIGSLEANIKQFKQYSHFLLFYHVYELENSFDWKGMMEGGKDFTTRLLKLKKELATSGDFLLLGAGGCNLCERCTYPEGKPCRRPDDAIISLEAYGIDVMGLMKTNGLKYNNGPNTMTLIGGVLYKD